MKNINVPGKALDIIHKLNEAGYEAYIVGGCVRDALLGRKPQDWDITTSAYPVDVKKIFRRTIDTGIEHGTVTVMAGDEGFEVTTYRIDGAYKDGRHPDNVTFTGSLKEDLARRDFTINAMAYHPMTGLVDEFEGIKDLREKKIRCVGNPKERFDEDALRMLRAVRFAAQLDFMVDGATCTAIRELCHNLNKISAERIRMELNKLITSDNPGKLRQAYELGITGVVLPEFDRMMETGQNNPHHCYSVGEHCLKSLEMLRNEVNLSHAADVEIYASIQETEETAGLAYKKQIPSEKTYSALCWTMLLHDVGKMDAKSTDEKGIDHFHGHNDLGEKLAVKILKRLKFDNETISFVKRLVYYHDYRCEPAPKAVRHLASKVGPENMPYFFMVQRADIMAQSDWLRQEKLLRVNESEKIYLNIVNEGQCLAVKDLKVTGRDLIESGIPAGPGMGEILGKLLEMVLENEKNNDREFLIMEAKKLYRNGLDN